MSDSRRFDCRTVLTDSGEMFAPGYRDDPSGEHLASYRKLFRLQGQLDSSVTGEAGPSRLLLARDVVSVVPSSDDFWLLGGQFFAVPPGSAARVSMKVRFDSDDDQGLRLQHYWQASTPTSSDKHDLRVAEFVVPTVHPGDRLRLVFNVHGLAGLSQVEAIVKGRSDAGSVTVEEYAIEPVDEPGSPTAGFQLVEAQLRSSAFRTRRLAELTLPDGQRCLASIPEHRDGRRVWLTDRRDHVDYTLLDGWWPTEEWASWTRERAHVYLDIEDVTADQLFTIEMVSSQRSVPDRRQVELRVNGRRVVTWAVSDVRSPFAEYRAVIPAELLRPGVNTFGIYPIGELESPLEVGTSRDARKLGVGVRWFSMRPADAG